MDKNNKFFDDMTQLTKSAFAGAAGMKRDISNFIKDQVETILSNMNFVRGEEFESLKKSVIKLKSEIAELKSEKKPKAKTKAEPKSKAKGRISGGKTTSNS